MNKTPAWAAACLLLAVVLSACAGSMPISLATPLPEEFLPTAAALTLAASGADIASPTREPAVPGIPPEPTSTYTLNSPSASPPLTDATASLPTATSASPAAASEGTKIQAPTTVAAPSMPEPTQAPTMAPTFILSFGTATFTPAPPIPDARIQIYRLGELSKIISPLDVSLRLTCGEAKTIRIELHGEDGRLLARYLRSYKNVPWEAARIGIPLDFEISSAAELGRLVVNAEDSFDRLIEVNSMDLVLLSQGMSELNPPTGMQQRIIIHDPAEQALIQNGQLIVSGRARPHFDRPLRAKLVAEDGRVLGQRLAGVSISIPGDYGHFIAEVPFTVTEITPALLVVFEEGQEMSEITYLTSIHVNLAP